MQTSFADTHELNDARTFEDAMQIVSSAMTFSESNNWLGFESADSDEYIRERFARKFGRQPDEIRDAGPIKLAGPIDHEELPF